MRRPLVSEGEPIQGGFAALELKFTLKWNQNGHMRFKVTGMTERPINDWKEERQTNHTRLFSNFHVCLEYITLLCHFGWTTDWSPHKQIKSWRG
jgi:hypothetical protein